MRENRPSGLAGGVARKRHPYPIMPPLCDKTMPLSLCVSFEVERRDRLLDLLKFLAPITTPTAWKELVM